VISIKDVARDVEMSTATVSRALRGLAGVSEETRERVMESARRLGYVPSPSAAGLASGQTRTVAVIVPMVTRWFFASVVQGAEEVLREHGYDLLLYNLAGDASARHRVFATSLLTKRVDAVLVLSLKPSDDELLGLAGLGRPVTIVGADLPGWATVRIDDRDAASTATGHLVGLGHRRIAYIGGATEGVLDFTAPTARLSGYRCTLEAAGIEPDAELEQDGEFTIAGGERATRALLALPSPPTAIFAASDEMAMGVLRAARELGLRVPEDLSVVGLDDHELADYFELTTVAQPVQEQGRVAATQVLAALSDDDWSPSQVILPTRLVVRRTTAPPSAQAPART
jgi:LacI family repressor for deo operon, udp, cdd, tsx, nupC, and nupG